jgi:hypothetical protein
MLALPKPETTRAVNKTKNEPANPNNIYPNAFTKIEPRIIGLLPIRSDNAPNRGAKMNWIIEKTAATNPTAISGLIPIEDSAAMDFAKFGNIGIMIPNPNKSIKIVRKRIEIRLSFIN